MGLGAGVGLGVGAGLAVAVGAGPDGTAGDGEGANVVPQPATVRIMAVETKRASSGQWRRAYLGATGRPKLTIAGPLANDRLRDDDYLPNSTCVTQSTTVSFESTPAVAVTGSSAIRATTATAVWTPERYGRHRGGPSGSCRLLGVAVRHTARHLATSRLSSLVLAEWRRHVSTSGQGRGLTALEEVNPLRTLPAWWA